jgi:uroporphyrinogen decarboxylase
MNPKQRALAILRYEQFDSLPLVHFGFWNETLDKWAREGHITTEEARNWFDATPEDRLIGERLGFDFNWSNCFFLHTGLRPPIEARVLEELPDGSLKMLDGNGVTVLLKKGTFGIPPELDHLLQDRRSWEEIFLPRLQFCEERVTRGHVTTGDKALPFTEGGLDYLERGEWEAPYGLFCGSLYGVIRNWLGMTGAVYLQADDEPLFDEIIDTVGELCYQCTKSVLERGARFDFAHFWEDICFRSGPLIRPDVFRAKVGPHYRRITDMLARYGIDVVSLDCDGKIDALVPVWLDHGVNTMFPIEVGVWNASIKPWRDAYGRRVRGVGGVNKVVFTRDYAAIDAEVERLKPLVELGGYLPCPDHRLPPDATWENVQYYCEKMRRAFG